MQKRKVMLIIPNLGRGGAQRVFWQQLDFFSGHFDTVGCVFNWDGSFESDKNRNVISLNVPAGETVFQKFFFFIARIRALRRLKKEMSINISISHLEGADYINILSRRKELIVCWIHGTKKHDENIEGLLGWVRKKILIPTLYRRSDKMVTVSEGIRDELIEEFALSRNKISVVSNGFDSNHIRQLSSVSVPAQLEGIFQGVDVIATHCRLARQKNLLALITVFAKVREKRKARLIVLGDGELREKLLAHAISLRLKCLTSWNDKDYADDADVFFLGHFDNPYPMISRSKLYLMTSMWEGFPLSLCEAMACEVPVFAADCYTGPREILAPTINERQPVKRPFILESGVLMPLANSDIANEAWADTICKLLDDPNTLRTIGISGSKRIMDFDLTKIQNAWLKAIDNN